jgi:hypothetical protein
VCRQVPENCRQFSQLKFEFFWFCVTKKFEWGEKRNAYRLLVGKPEGKRPLGRPRHRRVDNILGWILERWDGMMWTGLVWLRIGTGGKLL